MESSIYFYDLLQYLMSLVCHQIPDRTLIVGNQLLPLCARCTGIYSGFLIAIVYQFIRIRTVNQIPNHSTLLFSTAMIAVLIVDGFGEKFQLWILSNHARFLIGLLCGCSISLILLPLFNYFFTKQIPLLSINSKQYGLILSLIIFVFFLHYLPFSYALFKIISILGLLIMYTGVNLTFAGMILQVNNKKLSTTNKAITVGVVLILLVGEGILLTISR